MRDFGSTDTFRNLVLGVLLAIMIGWVLSIGRGVILPVVASLIVAYIILGLADGVGRLPVVGPRIPSPVRHVVAVLVIGAALFALMSLILSNAGQVAELAPEYQRRLLATIQTIAIRFGVETEPTWETLRRDVLGQINFQRVIGTTVASVSSLVATFVVVLIYAGFLLMEKGAFAKKVSRLSDDPARVAHIRRLIGDINSRIGTYLVMKTAINVLLGSLSYIVMRVAGIEFAGFWALLIGLFNYIPYVGSFLGVFFPVALSVLQFGGARPGDRDRAGAFGDAGAGRQFHRALADGHLAQPQPLRDPGQPGDLEQPLGSRRGDPRGADHRDSSSSSSPSSPAPARSRSSCPRTARSPGRGPLPRVKPPSPGRQEALLTPH